MNKYEVLCRPIPNGITHAKYIFKKNNLLNFSKRNSVFPSSETTQNIKIKS